MLVYSVLSEKSLYLCRRHPEPFVLPHLRIETDYSPPDPARIAVRVEALFETVRANALLHKKKPEKCNPGEL